MSYLNVANKYASELQVARISSIVDFLKAFDFTDATEDDDRYVTLSKSAPNGFIVVRLPMDSGEGFDVGYYINETTCLQSFHVHALQDVVKLAASMVMLSVNVQPALRETPVQKPVIAEPEVPAYFSDPAYVVDVELGTNPEEQMQTQAEKHGAATWLQFVPLNGVVANNLTIASRTLEQCQRYAQALRGWRVVSNCVYSRHKIMEQPTFKAWIDAKHKCKEMAEEHGWAGVVTEGTADDATYRVITAENADEGLDMIGDSNPSFEWLAGQTEG